VWTKFDYDLDKCNRKKMKQEVENRCMGGRINNSPYTKICELMKELEAISHANKDQECLRPGSIRGW